MIGENEMGCTRPGHSDEPVAAVVWCDECCHGACAAHRLVHDRGCSRTVHGRILEVLTGPMRQADIARALGWANNGAVRVPLLRLVSEGAVIRDGNTFRRAAP